MKKRITLKRVLSIIGLSSLIIIPVTLASCVRKKTQIDASKYTLFKHTEQNGKIITTSYIVRFFVKKSDVSSLNDLKKLTYRLQYDSHIPILNNQVSPVNTGMFDEFYFFDLHLPQLHVNEKILFVPSNILTSFTLLITKPTKAEPNLIDQTEVVEKATEYMHPELLKKKS